jgi:hypothetical protein
MTPITISLIAFGCVAVGVLLGARGHSLLSEKYRSADTKEVVGLGTGLVGTTVALVLGLLIGSAKNFYDTQNSEMTEIAATAILLDRILAHYGPETKDARDLLRGSIVSEVDRSQRKSNPDEPLFGTFFASGEPVFDKIQALSPQNDRQRSLQTQALGLMTKLGQTHWLIVEQRSSSVPMPLLAMLIFWLMLLFTSYGLFVRPNRAIVVSQMISALAVCGAIFLILEMYQVNSRLIRTSDTPLRVALTHLGQ